MISKWLEQAKRGQTIWLPDVREGCARMEDAVPVTMQLTLCDGSKRGFSLPLPRWQNEQEQQFVKQYVTACVYNTLSACSGREMAFYLDMRQTDAAALLGQLDEVFQVRRTARSGYGKVINIADRLCHAFGGGRFAFAVRPQEDYSPAPDAAPVQGQLTERLRQAAARCGSGVCCGIDIGGTDIKAAVAADGRLVCVKEYDWNPAASPTAEGIIAPIELLVRLMACCAAGLTPALERALDKNAGDAVMAQAVAESRSMPLDVLGVSFPDVVIRDRIVGGETPKTQGMRSNPAADYEDAFAELGGLLERLRPLCREGAALHMTNDGHIAAFTAAAELAWSGKPDFSGGVIAHALGTDFGMGFLAPDGTIPEMPMELYDFLLDMGSFPQRELPADDLRSTRNENSGLPGARRYLGQAAAFRLAWDGDPALLHAGAGRSADRPGGETQALSGAPDDPGGAGQCGGAGGVSPGGTAHRADQPGDGAAAAPPHQRALSVRAVRQGAGVLPTAAGGLPGDRPGAGAGGGGRGTERHAADAGAGSKGRHRGAVRTGDRRHVLRRHGAIKKSPPRG